MDDFFLQPHQRTSERLGETGGNIDYERFLEDVLIPLKSGTAFNYRRYDCRAGELGEVIAVEPNQLNVIEGVYSMHPRFTDFCDYDITVFIETDIQEQYRRLKERNADLFPRFADEWIPMENNYFEKFNLRKSSNVYLL
jgi:uridine kinase